MNRLNTFASLILEVAILAGLLWEHIKLYNLPIIYFLLLLVLLSTLFVYLLWKEFKEKNVSRKVRHKLVCLTVPSLFLCLLLVIGISMDLKKVSIVGGATKEMKEVAKKQGVENLSQWEKDTIEKMKSERIIYAMLLASIGILFEQRRSSYCQRPIERNSESKDPSE